jgi:hypothetical protein
VTGRRIGRLVNATGGQRLLAVPHEDPDHVMTGLQQQVRSDARINAATHRENHSCHVYFWDR